MTADRADPWLETHSVADIARLPKLTALREKIESDPAFIHALRLENGEASGASQACLGHVPLADVIAQFGR